MKNQLENHTSRVIVFLVTTMSAFLTPFMASSVNIALPSIGKEYALSAVAMGWVPTAYLLASAVFCVPFGRIADIYGRKKVFSCGILVFTLSALFLTVVKSAAMLIFLRVLQGIGGAMIYGTGVAMLTSVFPSEQRGKVLGINVATTYLGLSLGPFLGGVLTAHFGWKSVFFVTTCLGLITIVPIFWKLKGEWAEAKGEEFDLTGSVIYGLAIVALIYGLSLLPETSAAWLILPGILGFLAFTRWEIHVKSPILNMKLLMDNKVFAFSNLAALINYSATYAINFLMSLYLQYIKGFNPQNAGLVLLAMPAMQAILSPFIGRLSDRIQPRLLASTGMAITSGGLFTFIFLGEGTPFTFITGSLMLIGSGLALFSSPNTNAVMSSVATKSYGVASGTLGTMRLIGQMLSLATVMLIFALFIGKVQIVPEHYPLFLKSAKIAFTIFTVLCITGVFASLAQGKVNEAVKR